MKTCKILYTPSVPSFSIVVSNRYTDDLIAHAEYAFGVNLEDLVGYEYRLFMNAIIDTEKMLYCHGAYQSNKTKTEAVISWLTFKYFLDASGELKDIDNVLPD